MPHTRVFLVCLAGLAGSVLLENSTGFDRAVQTFFYVNGHWLIDRAAHARFHDLWYLGPKIIIGLVGGLCLLAALLSLKSRCLRKRLGRLRPFLVLLGLSVVCVPLVVAGLKTMTGVRGPEDLIHYGGVHPHIGMLSHLWNYGAVDGGRHFPAGHASGGFALMALGAAPARRGLRLLGFTLGLAAGWGMGLYQMARGEHFFSHTLATMFLAGCVITLLHRLCCRGDYKESTGFLRQ